MVDEFRKTLFRELDYRQEAQNLVTLRENLQALAELHGQEGPAHELMRSADQQLTGMSIEEIFDLGLHQFLGQFIIRNQAVATAISEQYRFIG